MRDILRLLLLVIVVLPLTLILAGPLLVVAAVRGSQAIGPIVLTPGHNRPSGRLLALVVGIVIWVGVWGGSGLLLVRNMPPPQLPTAAAVISASPSVTSPILDLTPTVAGAAVVPQSPSPTAPSQPTAPAQQTAPAPEVPAAATSEATRAPEPTAASTPTLAPPVTDTPSPPPLPVGPAQQADTIAAIEQANELLRQAVAQPTENNLAALETLWTEAALTKAQEFARGPSQMVGRPTEVSYAHLMPPIVEQSGVPEHLTVAVTEVWTYSGPKDTYTESFEFFYTLAQQDGEWRIYNYTYINAPQDETQSGPPSKYRPSGDQAQP